MVAVMAIGRIGFEGTMRAEMASPYAGLPARAARRSARSSGAVAEPVGDRAAGPRRRRRDRHRRRVPRAAAGAEVALRRRGGGARDHAVGRPRRHRLRRGAPGDARLRAGRGPPAHGACRRRAGRSLWSVAGKCHLARNVAGARRAGGGRAEGARRLARGPGEEVVRERERAEDRLRAGAHDVDARVRTDGEDRDSGRGGRERTRARARSA